MIPIATQPAGVVSDAPIGVVPAFQLAEAPGVPFLAAEIEAFLPGVTGGALQGEPIGVLAIGTLSRFPAPLADFSILRASDAGYVTRESDAGGLQTYPAILLSGIEIDRAMDLSPAGQGAAAAWGSLRLANDAGDLTALAATRNADGRRVSIRLGRKQPLAHPAIVNGAVPLIEAPGITSPALVTPLASVGVGGNGACVVLVAGSHLGGQNIVASISDGTNANRLTLRTNGAGTAFALEGRMAGASVAAVVQSGNPIAAGAAWRVALVLLGDGSARCVGEAGATLALTGGPASGLITLRIGTTEAGLTPWLGQADVARVIPYAVSDADARAALAGLV